MSALGLDKLPPETVGLKLHRIVGDDLRSSEAVLFNGGRNAVNTVLRRAAISGRVEVGGEIKDHFADVLVHRDGSWAETVSLDADSYRSLKRHWMRCRLEEAPAINHQAGEGE